MKVIKQYAHMLAATDPATIEKIKQFEKEGKFNEHLNPAVGEYIPVDGNYKYIETNPFKRFANFFKRLFVVRPFLRYTNKMFQTEVTGRENLKAIKKSGCIVCCNHVNKLDCAAVIYALRGKKVYTTGAEFNNMQGFLGDMMRVGGLLPLSTSYGAMKNLDATIAKLLKRGNAVTFYPERAEWWGYEKPRPLFSGAFKYAIKNNVPVLPVFITFKSLNGAESSASREDGTQLKRFVVNILPPLFPSGRQSPKDEVLRLKDGCADEWKNCYESFYKKPLIQ